MSWMSPASTTGAPSPGDTVDAHAPMLVAIASIDSKHFMNGMVVGGRAGVKRRAPRNSVRRTTLAERQPPSHGIAKPR
jgi:hypothetical protein